LGRRADLDELVRRDHTHGVTRAQVPVDLDPHQTTSPSGCCSISATTCVASVAAVSETLVGAAADGLNSLPTRGPGVNLIGSATQPWLTARSGYIWVASTSMVKSGMRVRTSVRTVLITSRATCSPIQRCLPSPNVVCLFGQRSSLTVSGSSNTSGSKFAAAYARKMRSP